MTGGFGLLLSSTGRSGRRAFWAGVLILVALLWLYERYVTGRLHDLTGWLVHFLLFFAGCSVVSRRLHDRERSGWWAGLIVPAFMIAWPSPRPGLDYVALVVLGWAAVELGLLPGHAAFNRFGAERRRT